MDTAVLNEQQVVDLLVSIGQSHLVKNIDDFSKADREAFVIQINKINLNYPGGLQEYVRRAKKLLNDSCDLVNPYEDYSPQVPQGEEVNFYDPKQMSHLESLGTLEIPHTCFVLVAGGMGERLGYDGIKVGIPIDLVTKQTFLEYYVHYILAFQEKFSKLLRHIQGKNKPLPFAIMTSDDTQDLTLQLLQQNQYFGMPKEQIILLKQEKIPAMLNNEAKFAQIQNSLLLDTKPHGHGDIHTLLFMSGLAKKWTQEGRKWMFIFQDTNPFALRALPSVLGVSKQRGFELNSIAVPRKTGETVGAICELKHKDGSQITINVEYNQLEPLMKTIGGEPASESGYSHFPGNINSLLFSLPEYNIVIQETKGLIAEFINPKYTDSTRTIFKSATRLECMMQDYPKLLKPESKVGFTMLNRKFCFTTVKNDLQTAALKHQQNLPLECAGSCESDFYWLNSELLKLAGANIEQRSADTHSHQFQGIGLNFGPKIVLHPSFGVTLDEIKSRIQGTQTILNTQGQLTVSLNSTLVLKGEAILKNVQVDGILNICGNGIFENISVIDKKYNEFKEVNINDKQLPTYLKIRGYTLN